MILNICERFFFPCCIYIYSFTLDFYSVGSHSEKKLKGRGDDKKHILYGLWFSCILLLFVGYAEITLEIRIYLPLGI